MHYLNYSKLIPENPQWRKPKFSVATDCNSAMYSHNADGSKMELKCVLP
jgi:hypothetical protein